jgi:hypothetical protein
MSKFFTFWMMVSSMRFEKDPKSIFSNFKFVCPRNVGDLPKQWRRQCQKTESSFVGFVGFDSP